MEELIFGVIGGTALLMYGVDMMGDGLEKASGDTMKKVLTVLTGNVVSAFLVGILVTAMVQSSTAVTVLTVGFVNSGLMKLPQAVGIIYGANIGTTVTAQLMSFSFNFNLTDVALPILGIGFAIERIVKNEKIKNLGQALMGFGMMFLGLKILNSGVPYMEQSEQLKYFFATYASNPIIGILLGAIVTALVHSSAATIGIIMILSEAGLLTLETAVFIILGENLGTCITAQLASQSGNINARRTAWAHTLYNTFGSLFIIIIFPIFMKIVEGFTHMLYGNNATISNYIANTHTLFNIINAMIFLPLTNYYVRFLERVIQPKDKKNEKDEELLDELLLATPVVAFEAARKEIARATDIVKDMLNDTMLIIYDDDLDDLDKIVDYEDEINDIQKDLTRYIVKLSEKELTDSGSIMIPAMTSSMSHIERTADRIYEISNILRKKENDHLTFSKDAIEELRNLEEIILKMADITIETLNGDFTNTEKIQVLEDSIDELTSKYQDNCYKRLNEGVCNVDSGVLHIDIIAHFERMGDHLYKTTKYAADELIGKKRKEELILNRNMQLDN